MIKQCTEIASEASCFQMWTDQDENHWVSITEDGRISNIMLESFDSNELKLLMRHIHAAFHAVEEGKENEDKK